MSSKQEILSSIRRHRIEPVEHPSLESDWITYADPRRQFAETLAGVGGRCVSVADAAALNSELEGLAAFTDSRTICSFVPGITRANVDLDAIDDPHELADVDFAVLPGKLAVAENAAVWVTDECVRHRAIYFIAQHVALFVPAERVVSNMHEAYRELAGSPGGNGAPGLFRKPGFGTFISGPSKTADIEQSLVIGAHGARSLTVFLIG
jgi:L-lactate dehydrogenase complex protein LldG